MATAVWNFGTWSISNGGLTATSPNTGHGTPSANQGGAINEEDASIAIPNNANTYYEFQVSGAALYTAFGVGFGELGANDGGYKPGLVSSNSVPKGAAELEFSYNLGIAEGQSIVYNPQANAPQPPPNQWADGSTIGVEVDRIDNTATFFLNGQQQGGPINISAMAGETLYPMVSSWFLAGPRATLIGNPSNTPAGYTNLDDVGSQTTTPPPPPSAVTIGSGPDTLALKVSEDAYLGNAQFTVSVDGHQIGGTQTTTALHAAGQTQTFNVLGTFAAGSHTVTVNFLNDAYGGSPSLDRNLFVTGATIDNTAVPGATLTEHFPGPQSLSFQISGSPGSGTSAPVSIGSGPDALALQVSEDAYLGNAQFTVAVDGHQIGGAQTTMALHGAGQTQTFNVRGTFAAGSHTATVDFLNDAYGGSPGTDRNLYVNGAMIDGSVVSGATLTEHFQGPQSFSFLAPGASGSTGDTVTVNRPAALIAGVQNISGTESDPSQSIFLDWRGFGTPVIGDSDWVQATVAPSGSFSAQMTIDHAGAQGTMFYRIGSGPTIAAWSGAPS
jgi:Ca-dependent carbohydrate-binding module xylan-binding